MAYQQMLEVLSGYTLEIVEEATRPSSGLQRSHVHPPRIAEIVKFCDALAAREARFSRYQNWGKRQIEEPTEPRMTREQLEARYGGSLLPKDFGVVAPQPVSGFTTGQALPAEMVFAAYQSNRARAQHLTAPLGERRSLRYR